MTTDDALDDAKRGDVINEMEARLLRVEAERDALAKKLDAALTVAKMFCEERDMGAEEIKRLDTHIDNLAHQATHVTCRMERRALEAERDALTAACAQLHAEREEKP